jgi:hypothetical protein
MRAKGHNKCQVEQKNSLETILFNARLSKDDLELASLLLQQEQGKREFPSAALVRSRELLERIARWNQETITEAESLYSSPLNAE